ncbi:MAG TPA: methyltransferase domain-containing protein [Longimicrobium sp.]|jgi:SAM-dependent methyltransferase
MKLIVGCGPKPVPEGWVGIDVNEDYLRRAREISPSTEVFYGDATNLPFEDDSVDELVCWEVLEHIEDKEKALSEFHRVSRPGAKLTLTTPMLHIEQELGRRSRNYQQSVVDTQHQFCVPPEETLSLIKRYYDLSRVWYAPEAYAYCRAIAPLLDEYDVRFNDAGDLVGENAKLVHELATRKQRRTSWFYRLVNRIRPYSATKSICIAGECRKPLAA